MKLLLISIFVSTITLANCNLDEQRARIELMQESYLTGCKEGLNVIVDLGLYKEPRLLSSNDVVNLVEGKCKEKALLYVAEKGTCDGK